MTTKIIEIVERGRGPQLSTSRITVQDLVPHFQEGCAPDEIMRWIPTLSSEEIAVVERCYREHQQELDEEDRLIRERSGQNKNAPWVAKVLEEARAERLAIMGAATPAAGQRRGQVKGIMADANIQGQVDLLVALMQAEPWKLFWDHLQLQHVQFADVGLLADSLDSLGWETCQKEQLVLITDNLP